MPGVSSTSRTEFGNMFTCSNCEGAIRDDDKIDIESEEENFADIDPKSDMEQPRIS